jgi:hypothetical protein
MTSVRASNLVHGIVFTADCHKAALLHFSGTKRQKIDHEFRQFKKGFRLAAVTKDHDV